MDFSGKHVFITGGSRGIGRAIATAFAAGGARVAINYLSNTDAAEKTLASLEGGPHMRVQGDVSDPESVRHMIETVVDDFGALDIVVVLFSGIPLAGHFLSIALGIGGCSSITGLRFSTMLIRLTAWRE